MGDAYRFGAGCDGDGDRNMVLAGVVSVNPATRPGSITANAHRGAGLFPAAGGGGALDATSAAGMWWPRSWAFPCLCSPHGLGILRAKPALMPGRDQPLCGGESFGTGSGPYPRKTGWTFWAVLFGLQIPGGAPLFRWLS